VVAGDVASSVGVHVVRYLHWCLSLGGLSRRWNCTPLWTIKSN
jgi:hypothetical protein